MQASCGAALPKRSRLYQSHIDIFQLRRGEPYDKLRPCYVIFLCKHDPFGHDFCRCSFRSRCDEKSRITLDDGMYTGYVGDISPKLRELLRYMNNTRDYPLSQSSDGLIRRIDYAVKEAKMNRNLCQKRIKNAFSNAAGIHELSC